MSHDGKKRKVATCSRGSYNLWYRAKYMCQLRSMNEYDHPPPKRSRISGKRIGIEDPANQCKSLWLNLSPDNIILCFSSGDR